MQYDYLNRLTQISSTSSATNTVSYNYSYNSANQRTRVNLVDGSYWLYQYDSLGQVISASKHWSDETPVAGQQFEYTFDNIGNRTQTQTGGDQNGMNLRLANYYANSLNQLTNRNIPAYVDIKGVSIATNTVTVNGQTAYRKVEYFRDELGMSNSSSALWTNIITAATGQTSVTGNVFVAQDPETFGYDADGNLTNDGRFNYAWDAENRLTNLTSLASGPAGSLLNLAFAYDYQGRRIQKIVSTNNGSYIPEYTNRFLYDGWNLVAETAPNNSLIRSYMWGSDLSGSPQGAGGVSGLLEVSYYGSATTNCFPAFDGNGNVAALINAADGTVSANYEYGPFGEPIRMTGAMAKDNPFRFSTKYDDDESDLLYYGYRYYKPSTGTWPNQDPLGDLAFFQGHTGNSENKVQQLQRRSLLPSYLFVQNNPIVKFDLLGLYANCCCDSQTIQDGENSLISEYNQAVSYLAPYRPTPMPDDNSWSCLGVSLNIGHFMEPSPHCWTCYMADHWTKRFGFDIHDLNVIVCESHPQTGPTQKIVFDYWDLAPPAQDYSVYESSHPDQRSPDVPFKSADCSQSQKWTANNNYLNAIINPTGPIQ